MYSAHLIYVKARAETREAREPVRPTNNADWNFDFCETPTTTLHQTLHTFIQPKQTSNLHYSSQAPGALEALEAPEPRNPRDPWGP